MASVEDRLRQALWLNHGIPFSLPNSELSRRQLLPSNAGDSQEMLSTLLVYTQD